MQSFLQIATKRLLHREPVLCLKRPIARLHEKILNFFARIDDARRSLSIMETDIRARSRFSGCWRTIPGGGVADGLQCVSVPCRRDTGRTRKVSGRWSEASELR